MKKLLLVLTLSLAASTAFAEEKGNTAVQIMSNVKIASVKLTGSAAASLYNFLDVREVESKAFHGSMMKTGDNITCYMSYNTPNHMISPVFQLYNCSMIVTPKGNIEADIEMGSN